MDADYFEEHLPGNPFISVKQWQVRSTKAFLPFNLKIT